MQYIQKIPGVSDMCYANRGTVVHECLETFYKNKQTEQSIIAEQFEQLWTKFKLDETKLAHEKELTWEMILNGIKLNFDLTHTELKIFFPDCVSYLDGVNTETHFMCDWKTSQMNEHNKLEYTVQMKYYVWQYYRKYNILLKEIKVCYLRYENSVMIIIPTIQDIKNAEQYHKKTLEKIHYYLNNPDKLPPFNKGYFFCPYKHLWDVEEQNPETTMNFLLNIYGGEVFVKGDFSEELNELLFNKYTYENQSAIFLKKRYPNMNTKKCLWNKKFKNISIGLVDSLVETIHNYARSINKTPIIKLQDNRCFDETKIDMPQKLLSGKELRDYQIQAVDTYINKKGLNNGILELSTGAGKTLITIEIVRRLGLKTLFVVDKKRLLTQTKKEFETELGTPIGIIGMGNKQIENITIATIQSLIKYKDELEDYFKTIRVFIVDECHKTHSPRFITLSKLLKNTEYRLGVSATAKNNQGCDLRVTSILGEVIYSLKGQELITKGFLVKPEIIFLTDVNTKEELELMENKCNELILEEIDKKLSEQNKFVDKTLKAYGDLVDNLKDGIKYRIFFDECIINNTKRNETIKQLCENHSNKTILILVKYVKHGELLEQLIPNSKYLHGKISDKKREQMFEDFTDGSQKILISTISIFEEGIDIPRLNIVINASAHKLERTSIQTLGRALRTHDSKDNAIYYDFFDNIVFFKLSSIGRIRGFKKEGHEVTKNKTFI